MSIALLTILFAPDYLRPRGLPMAEFAAVLVFAITGAMLIAGARDLLLLFLGLELMVLPGYLLAGYAKRDGLVDRGRDQVLPARLVLERDLPVRACRSSSASPARRASTAWPMQLAEIAAGRAPLAPAW